MSNATTLTGSSKQYIGVVDMICEGPIYGLVEGKNSVYLDNVPFETSTQVGSFTSETSAATLPTINFTGSNGGTVTGVTLTDADVGKSIVLEVDSASVTSISSYNIYGYTQFTVNSPSGSFNSSWSTYQNPARMIVLENSAGVRVEGQGIVSTGITNTLTFLGAPSRRFNTTGNYWTIRLLEASEIESVNTANNSLQTIDNIYGASSGTSAKFYIRDKVTTTADDPNVDSTVSKVEGSTLQFRIGTQEQAPIQQVHGVSGGVSRTGSGNAVDIKQYNGSSPSLSSYTTGTGLSVDTFYYPEGQSLSKNGGDQRTFSASSFGASGVEGQVDEVNIRINYNSLITYNNEKGSTEDAHAIYVFEIETEFNNIGSGFKRLFSQQGGYVVHRGKTTAPVSFDHTIGLERFKPFDDFTIRVTRLTRDVGISVWSDGSTGGRTDRDKWSLQAVANTGGANLSCTIKDKFTYPHTAIGAISFSSKSYNQLPVRSYLVQGLKVRIPDSYTPREYSSDGVAKYDEYWTGSFKDELYYTDNPAWVFYDIVTNNRYGAGRWLEGAEINKFALYRIAKYCDELVDDGNGGTEPRFRSNIYLAKATDVYKVLKDMATVFTGMLYWMDGKLTAVQDTPADPIYTFTKGNVIDGQFNYESTGRKTRVNQVVVTWNDPTSNYEPRNIIVEDREDIVKTRKIISQSAVAMGATSEGQAIRYGRWKLWTAQNQKEVISFETGLQGAYIRPGDVINVQDRDRYGVDYSGLINTATASSVTLDRTITTVTGVNSYELSTVVTNFAAFYTGLDTIHINNSTGRKVSSNPGNGTVTTFNRGDRYTAVFWYPDPHVSNGEVNGFHAYYSSSNPPGFEANELGANANDIYDLSVAGAENAISQAHYLIAETGGNLGSTGDPSGSGYSTYPLPLEWKEHTYVVTKTVTISGSTATPSSNYNANEIPAAKSVWALKAVDSSNVNILGSKKEYRVLGISQNDSKNTFGISAVEHYNSKYDAVDKDYALGVIPDNVYPEIEDTDLDVPAPGNIYVVIETDSNRPGEELRLEWSKPQETYTDASNNTQERDYQFLEGYELHHNIPELESPIFTSRNSYQFTGLKNAFYTFRVRTVSQKRNYSDYVSTFYEVDDPFGANVPRVVGGLPKGLVANSSILYSYDPNITDVNTRAIRWENGSASGYSIGNTFNSDFGVSTSLSNVDVNGLAAAYNYYSSDTNAKEWYWLHYDNGTCSLAWWDTDTLEGLPFYRKGVSWRGESQASDWTQLSGTASLPANSTRLTTSVSHGLSIRDIVTFDEHEDFAANLIDSAVIDSNQVTLSVASAETHGLSTGDKIIVEQTNGSSLLNGQYFFVRVTNSTTVKLFPTAADAAANLNPVNEDYFSPSTIGSWTDSGWFRKIHAKAAKVVGVVSSTQVILDRSFTNAYSNITLYKAAYRPDYTDDAIFGRARWLSFNSQNAVGSQHAYAFESFIILDPELDQGKFVIVTPDVSTIQYSADGSTQITSPSSINVTVTAVGFLEPKFKVTAVDNGLDGGTNGVDTDFNAPDNVGGFTYTKEVDADGTVPYGTGQNAGLAATIAATVVETYNPGLGADGEGVIVKATSGSDGLDGKTVSLDSEDFTIIYDENGENPIFNDTAGNSTDITFTAAPGGFGSDTVHYRFTLNTGNVYASNQFTTSGFGTWNTGTNSEIATLTVPTAWSTSWNNTNKNQRSLKVKVEASSDGGSTVHAFDEITIMGIHSLSGGYWVSLSNEAHTIPTTSLGVPLGVTAGTDLVTGAGSGTSIEVGKGADILSYVAPATWSTYTDEDKLGKYSITAFTETPDAGFNRGTLDTSTPTLIEFADHEFYTNGNWNQDTASLSMQLELEAEITLNRNQTFSKSKQGFGGISITNTNPIQAFPCDKNGKPISLSDTGTSINALLSGQSLPYHSNSYASTNNITTYWNIEDSSPTVTVGGSSNLSIGSVTTPSEGSEDPIVIADHSSTTGTTSASGPFTITYYVSVYVDGIEENINVTQILRKNTNGSAVYLASDANHINFDTSEANPDPSSYELSWTNILPAEHDGTVYYKLYTASSTTQLLTNNTATSFPVSNPTYASLPIRYILDMYEDYDSGTSTFSGLLASDRTIIGKSKDGSSGTDGLSVQLVAERAAVAYSKNAQGTFDPDDSSVSLQVVTSGITNPAYAWSQQVLSTSQTTSVNTVPFASGLQEAQIAAKTASVEVTGQNSQGQAITAIQRSITIPIATGAVGADGDAALRVSSGFIYYQQSSSSSPTSGQQVSTSGTDFTFSSGQFTGLQQGWLTTAPTFQAANSNVYWYAYYTVKEARDSDGLPANSTQYDSATGDYQAGDITFSAPLQGMGFTGLVTFTSQNSVSNGQQQSLSFGSGGTTTIDGGSIITNSIQANKINLSSMSSQQTTAILQQTGAQTQAFDQSSDVDVTQTQNYDQVITVQQYSTQITPGNIGVYDTTQVYQKSQTYSQQQTYSIGQAQATFETSLDVQQAITQATSSFVDSGQVTTQIQQQSPVQSVNGQTGAVSGLLNFTVSGTQVQAGKIVLTSGNVIFTTSTQTTVYQPQNSIVLDTTSQSNSIRIYDGGTERVRLGKL